jgi:uncharacterized protein (DUF362 family)
MPPQLAPTRVGLSCLPIEHRRKAAEAYNDADTLTGLIRDAMIAGGLGQREPASPLTDVIHPGMSVLLKPNWVLHENHSGQGMDCMVTHPAFILAVLREVLAARPGKIIVGDAPVQGCVWERLVTPALRRDLTRVAEEAGVPLEIVDFRRTILTKGTLSRGVSTDARDEARYVFLDLGADSMLEPISDPPGRFRVPMYDPDKFAETHRPGRHQYLLCREALDAEVVLNLPKLKTHRKAGMTAALKNLVGINGNKDFLPHHRKGSPMTGGDSHPDASRLKRLAESCIDASNRRIGTAATWRWQQYARFMLGLHRLFKGGSVDIEGGWYGNDTCWRMVLDLNRALLYGRRDGTMADTAQRTVYSLTDAIVCGEGEGPLAPHPRPVGAVTFAVNSVASEVASAALLRMEPRKLALVREAFGRFRWPLIAPDAQVDIRFGDRTLTPWDLASEFGVDARPPQGWVDHVEWDAVRGPNRLAKTA